MITVNTTEYKDDFAQNNPAEGTVDKNYLRILFNGGRSVQIRELNQIQSTLQSQIDKFGSSIWKTGANVIGGSCTFDNNIHAISFSTPLIDIQLNSAQLAEIDTLVQGTGSTAIAADVLAYDKDSVNTTFYVRYSSGGEADNSAGQFQPTPNIAIEARATNGTTASVELSDQYIVAGAFLSEGVFFINGSFVVTPKQDVFIPLPLLGELNGAVVLEVAETIVTYLDDSSLLDNADGRPNHLAPGADRYQITLSLAYLDDDAVADNLNRITLMRIKNSRIVQAVKSNYSDLDRVLAQRTYEESGNYIVNPFKISIADLTGSQRPGSEEVDSDDKVYIGLEPSVAYVDGYRVELTEKLDLVAYRARDVEEKEVSISLGIGNYVDVSIEPGSNIPLPNRIDLVYNLRDINDVLIGTCRIKSIESVGALWRVFLYDIVMSGVNNISDVSSIFYDNGSDDVELNIPLNSTIQDTSNDTAVFKLPYSNVRSVAAINPSDLRYVIKKTYTDVVVASGADRLFSISTAANESFGDSSVSNFVVEVNGTALATSDIAIHGIPTSSNITIKSSGVAWTTGQSVKAIFPVTVESNVPATKTLTQVTSTALPAVGNIYTLLTTDIFDIVSVVINGTATPIANVIAIEFDGQTPSKYTNSLLRYTGTGTAPTIDVVYRHFIHSGLPFTANSYPINWDDNTTVAGQIHYRDIPRFRENSLADCVDFRPTILVTPGTTNVIGAPLTAIQPDPNSMLTCKPRFFLPRIDKLIVNAGGEFKIISGIPKIAPIAPHTPPASMALYELTFPSYTFDAADIQVSFIDNRRYTMRDIGKLDRRINNLEYYTSLSLLESSINSKSIFDSVQGSRFKNGIMVDSFSGHGVGNVFNPAYACSIDMGEQTLRPRFTTDAVDLVFVASPPTDSGIRVNENTITLAYTTTPLISQLKSSESESVNPYDVAAFIGTVKLYPTNDTWMEVNRRPDVIVNEDGAYDAFKHLARETNILGTEWNRWKTKWKGSVTLSKAAPHSVRAPDGVMRASETLAISKLQSKSGVKTVLKSSITSESLGDRVIDISVVPFIRARRVYFSVKGLKPSTKVYPFFDGISISDYTVTTGSVVYPHQRTSVKEYFNKVPGDTGFITPGALVTSDNGSLIGQFVIPNNTLVKFKCGERVFKLTDSESNNAEEETTFAESVYNASGTAQTVEETIISTRVPHIKKERVRKNRVTTDVKTRYFDPLAQTFIINDIVEGAFVTSLDLWFTSKSTTKIPVTIRLVAVDNGYPTQRVIPFSEVTLDDDQVNIDGDRTQFVFSDPVYLKAGTEYAIVLLSNDPAYRILVSRLGGTDEDNNIIQSNPYGGVMFMSQNASTWTPDQTRDMKFVLNRAVFSKTVPGYIEFKTIMREGVQSISVLTAGVNYSNNTYDGAGVQLTGALVTLSAPPSGEQAYARSVVDASTGEITSIIITDPGSGYVTAPTVTITHLPLTADANATATAYLYEAKASAFTLIQSSSTQKEADLTHSLLFGSTTYQNIDPDETYQAISEFSVTQANRATLQSSLTTTSEYITPVIDLDSMALLTIENEVNNLLTNETTLDAGSARSRYITREAELNDPADQLNIYLDANRPNESTNVTLYVKLKYDSVTYSDWILVSPQVKIPITADAETYEEVQYIHDSSTNDFISFAVKLVFTSASSVDVATVKNLRIIATS